MPYYPQPPWYIAPVGDTQLEDMPDGTIKGRAIGAGTGDPQNLTTINGSQIAADSITAAQIQNAAITSNELASGAVLTEHITDGQVTSAKIAANSVGSTQFVDMADGSVFGRAVGAGIGDPYGLNINDVAFMNSQSGIAQTINHRTTHIAMDGALIGNPGPNYGSVEFKGDGNGAAMITFHRPGAFAAYFGVDWDNIWKVGGWSMGANAYALFHAGNYASKAMMETPWSYSANPVVPWSVAYHPGVAKAWCLLNTGAGLGLNYNVSSTQDFQPGHVGMSFGTLTSSLFCGTGQVFCNFAAVLTRIQSQDVNNLQIVCTNTSGTLIDPNYYMLLAHGTFA